MTRVVVGAVALLVALAGCGGDDPKAEPSSIGSTTPATAGSTPPVVPEAAKVNSRAGAVAFVRHYVDALNYAQSTGEVAVLDDISDSSCRSCSDVQKGLRAIYDDGGKIVGGQWDVHDLVDAHVNQAANSWTVTIRVQYGEQTITRGSESDFTAGGTHVMTFRISHDGGKWMVREWSRST